MFEQPIKATSFVDTLCWRFPGVYLKPSVVRFLRFLARPRRHYLFPAEMAEDISLSEIFSQTIDNCFALQEFVSKLNSNVLLHSFYRSAILRAGSSRMATVADENCQTLPRCWSSLFLLFSSCFCFQLHFVLVLCFKNFAALLIFLVPSVFFLPLFSTPLCSCSLF